MKPSNSRRELEVGTLLRDYYCDLEQNYQMSYEQDKAITDIISCRTAEIGGHTRECTHCHHKEQAYNSCRNRHCPKCQFTKQIQWVDKLKSQLPSVRYYHIVFTIPQALHQMFYTNQSVCYDLLLKQACCALKQVVRTRITPVIDIGGISLLHTWGQTLTYHPHVHMLVPAGGITEDRMEWVHTNKKFFVPAKVLSTIFRGLLCKGIERATESGKIYMPKDLSWSDLKGKLYEKNWNVNIKPALNSPNNVLEYLGRYTHRVAIANERITRVEQDKVYFRIKDYRCGAMTKTTSLPVLEFLRRFLQHVLPSGFYKIRYFGFMAQRNIGDLGQHVFALLDQTSLVPEYVGLSGVELFYNLNKNLSRICPVCSIGQLVPSHLIAAPS